MTDLLRNTAYDVAIRDDLMDRVILSPVAIGYADNSGPWKFGFQTHPFIRLYYVAEGCFQLSYADRTVDILPNRLYLIPGRMPFSYVYKGDNTHYWAHFNSNFLEQLPTLRYPLDVPEQDFPEMKKLFKSLLSCSSLEMTFENRLELRIILQRLVRPFLEMIEIGKDTYLPPKIEKLSSVIEYIHKNLDKGINCGQLSSMAHMRRAEFSALFRKIFGMPPKHYLCAQRIQEAKRMLLRTDMTTKLIAVKIGYADERFFYRVFKKYTGKTPSEYRKENFFV